jgi:hypothetical protein
MSTHDLTLLNRLRTEHTHPLLPRTVKEVMHEYRRQRSGVVAAHVAKVAALGLDFKWNDRVGPYGGYTSPLTLDAEALRKSGFDPEHLTAQVEVAHDDFHQSGEEVARDCGYVVEKADWRQFVDDDRPSHESAKVDYSGPRERSDFRWVTLGYRDEKHFLDGPAWKGMGRGLRAFVRHERLKGAAESMADYMDKFARDDLKSFNVTVTLYWRGEEVASDSMGGCEVEDGRTRDVERQVAEFILDYGLHGNALHEAERWADGAVSDAQAKAARLINDIALLPERSIEVVRGQFRTATVTNIRKEA